MNFNILFILVLGVVLISGCTGAQDQVTGPPQSDHHAEEHSVSVTEMPSSVQTGETFSITYQVTSDEPETISHTAIHYDTESHPGDFDTGVTPADSGYSELTPEFANGQFPVPNLFTVSITAPDTAGNLYLRAHAIIGDDNFWSIEQTITITTVEPSAHAISITSMPTSVQTEELFTVSWEITGDQKTIPHTAIHYDTESHPGDFGLDVAPGDSGYAELTPDFASGEFVIPDTFSVPITAPNTSGALYLRVHAIIDGQQYWTAEQMITTITAEAPPANTVTISASGFDPAAITISVGDTVTWVNNDLALHRPASDVHPAHTAYPGSDIQKCSTQEKDIIFDACEGIHQGGSYSFTFNELGTWNYHDHLNPGTKGTVIVQ